MKRLHFHCRLVVLGLCLTLGGLAGADPVVTPTFLGMINSPNGGTISIPSCPQGMFASGIYILEGGWLAQIGLDCVGVDNAAWVGGSVLGPSVGGDGSQHGWGAQCPT